MKKYLLFLHFEEGPEIPVLNFERGPGSRVPGFRGPTSRVPGPTFTLRRLNAKLLA